VSHPYGVIVHAVLDVPVPEYPFTLMTSSLAVKLETVPVILKPPDVAMIDFPAMKLKLLTVKSLNRVGSYEPVTVVAGGRTIAVGDVADAVSHI